MRKLIILLAIILAGCESEEKKEEKKEDDKPFSIISPFDTVNSNTIKGKWIFVDGERITYYLLYNRGNNLLFKEYIKDAVLFHSQAIVPFYDSLIVKSDLDGKIKFSFPLIEQRGDYFLLESNGNLGVYNHAKFGNEPDIKYGEARITP